MTKPAAVEHARLVAFSIPRPIAFPPILEAVSRLGTSIPDSVSKKAELETQMKSFSRRISGMLGKMVYLHSLRYGEGYYEDRDKDCSEQDRVNVLISYSLYLSSRVESLYPRVLELDDAGASALFEQVLREANKLIGKNYSRRTIPDLVSAYALLEPLLVAAQHRMELSDEIIPNAQIFNSMKPETLRRIISCMDKIYGPDQ